MVGTQQVEPLCHDKQLKTPLHDACRNGNKDVVLSLLKEFVKYEALEQSISDKTKAGSSPLHFAAASGSLELVQYLITECKCNPSISGHLGATPLHVAAKEGHFTIIEYLTDVHSCDPLHKLDNSEETPLHFAAGNGHVDIVKHFVTIKRL